jgi:hypothetical protein
MLVCSCGCTGVTPELPECEGAEYIIASSASAALSNGSSRSLILACCCALSRGTAPASCTRCCSMLGFREPAALCSFTVAATAAVWRRCAMIAKALITCDQGQGRPAQGASYGDGSMGSSKGRLQHCTGA